MGTRGGTGSHQGISVSAVRILPTEGRDNCFQLSFLCKFGGFVRLILEEAGDSSAISRRDIRAVGTELSLDRVHVKQGQRTVVEITANEPIGGRAWRLSATVAAEECLT